MNRGYIYLLLATLLFSSMEAVLKTVALDFHPMQLNCTRFLAGGLLLIPFARRALAKRGVTISFADWKDFALLGFIGLFLSMTLFQLSILYTPASVVSVLFCCNPILVTPLAYLILKAEIQRSQIMALVLEVIGACVIVYPLRSHISLTGVTFVLLSAGLFALYAVVGKQQCARYSGLAVTCFSCLAASAEMLLFMAATHIPFVVEILHSTGLSLFAEIPFTSGYRADNIAAMLYICICVTAGGYATFFMGMEATSAITGTLVFFFKPVIAPILAMLMLGEVVTPNMWAGIALMLAASALSMLPALHTLPLLRPLIEARSIQKKD